MSFLRLFFRLLVVVARPLLCLLVDVARSPSLVSSPPLCLLVVVARPLICFLVYVARSPLVSPPPLCLLVDVARPPSLVSPPSLASFKNCMIPEFIKQIGVQVFIDGLTDSEMQQTLRLGRHVTFSEALIAALEFKAAKEASRGYRHKAREVKFEETESLKDVMSKLLNKLDGLTKSPPEARRCYNCGRTGRLQRFCRSRSTSQRRERSPNLGQERSRSRSPSDGSWRKRRSLRRRSSPTRVPEPRVRSRSPADISRLT